MTPRAAAAVDMLDDLRIEIPNLGPTEAARLAGLLAELQLLASAQVRSAAPTPLLEDRLLGALEAARLLGVGRRTLYQHADEFDFTVRTGSRLRFSLVGLQRYLSRKRGDGGRIR